MNNSLLKKTVIAMPLLFSAAAAMANTPTSSSTLNVSGNIVTSTCAVAAGDLNKTIALPTVLTSDLLNANNLQPVTFSFAINNCDSSKSQARATIGGTTSGSDVSGYGSNSVIANTGTATNVGIGFLGASSVSASPTGPLAVGSASASTALNAVGGASTTSGTLYLSAQVVPLTKAVQAGSGTVAGTATVTFTYS